MTEAIKQSINFKGIVVVCLTMVLLLGFHLGFLVITDHIAWDLNEEYGPFYAHLYLLHCVFIGPFLLAYGRFKIAIGAYYFLVILWMAITGKRPSPGFYTSNELEALMCLLAPFTVFWLMWLFYVIGKRVLGLK